MSDSKSPDASNKSEIDAIKEKSKSNSEIHKEDVQWMMNNVRGRRFIWNHLIKCHVFETSFSPNLSQTNFNEGERNIGLQIFNDIMQNAPEKYMKMAEENSK